MLPFLIVVQVKKKEEKKSEFWVQLKVKVLTQNGRATTTTYDSLAKN